jgi:chorismate mutase
MNARSDNLELLRCEIDAIDDAVHDLLIRRAETVRRIGALKRPRGAAAAPPRRAP